MVGPGFKNRLNFIDSVCDEVVVKTDKLVFGRLQINEQLVIHLYGLDLTVDDIDSAWDLISKKLLGYIILLNWTNPDSYLDAKSTIDSISSRYKIPLIIAANLKNGQDQIPAQLQNVKIELSQQAQFTFCQLSNKKSIKNVLVMLINSILDRMN